MIPNTVRYNVESAATRWLWSKIPYVHLNLLILTFLHTFFTWNNCLFSMNFGIMILRKINFDIIWYSVIFAATLYCQYSSDHLICWTSFLWMLSFLFMLYTYMIFEMLNSRKINFSTISKASLFSSKTQVHIKNTVFSFWMI